MAAVGGRDAPTLLDSPGHAAGMRCRYQLSFLLTTERDAPQERAPKGAGGCGGMCEHPLEVVGSE
jgi:hypothetical protein